jgi:HPt (histidine-containing phosphotransfer) domain-containing protein
VKFKMTDQQSVRKIRIYLLSRFDLTEEQVESMLPGFIETLATHLQSLESGLAANDSMKIGKAAHTFKGALLNLGMEDCAQIASLIEEQGKAGSAPTNLQKLVDELRVCLAPVICP